MKQLSLTERSKNNVTQIEAPTSTATIFRFHPEHFGLVADPLLQQLMSSSSTKRERKVAFNAFGRFLQQTKQVPKNFDILDIGFTVTKGGDLWILVYTDRKTQPVTTLMGSQQGGND